MFNKLCAKKVKNLPGTEQAAMTEQEAAAYWAKIAKQAEDVKNVVHGW